MSYIHRRYLLMTHDPTHIGAGGYRIGRVDNSIVREPGTNLPKIPGTSLSGAIRSYAAYRYGEIRCAGQGQKDKVKPDSGHCGEPTCPICYTFGYTVNKKGDDSEVSYSGTVNIYDAHIVLFPVSSMIGPLWISTKHRLEEFRFKVENGGGTIAEDAEKCALTLDHKKQPINLGWLMLDTEEQTATVGVPEGSDWATGTEWNSIEKRIALVPDSLFSQLVNSGLEVRTSVSINPETGAAETGALFTYEALPRATFLAFDLVQDDYRNGANKWEDKAKELSWREPHQVVESGLQWASALGIGGMSTRGFGRIGLVGSGWGVQQ
jgi:CRISPR-associated protein Cmr4